MAEGPIFPINKRHAMHFRRRSPTPEMITAQFPNPKSGHLSPKNVSISGYHTPATIDEALALSEASSFSASHHSNNSKQARHPLERSQSSQYYLEIRKSPGPGELKSRKKDAATIETDATETQPAFESDAFAVQMPTTREPILDKSVFRAKLPSPSRAQVEAYQTYKHKAQQVREWNSNEGVQVPSKIVSYDYACAVKTDQPQPLELDVSPVDTPIQVSPAGSFPISPPIPQHSWTEPRPKPQVRGPRSMSESSNISIARKPVGLGHVTLSTRPRFQRGDADVGASHSPVQTPTKVKVRLKPKIAEADRPQKESWWGLYNRSPQASTDGSRSPSPTKSIPTFAYTTPGASDAVFGFNTNDITGTAAAAESITKAKKKKEATPKQPLISRWAWLRPAGPRVAKPTIISAPIAIPEKAAAYVDPFALHVTPAPTHPSTPAASRPPSPKKLARLSPVATAPVEEKKFETGFEQVKSLGFLIFKICVLVYALVGLYFVLDAIKQAVYVLGAPFRSIKMVGSYFWAGCAWFANLLFKAS